MIYLAFSKVSEILRLTWTAKPNECPTGAWDKVFVTARTYGLGLLGQTVRYSHNSHRLDPIALKYLPPGNIS